MKLKLRCLTPTEDENMPTHEFEVQKLIKIQVECDNKDAARMYLVDNIQGYAIDMVNDCYISDGEEVKDE